MYEYVFVSFITAQTSKYLNSILKVTRLVILSLFYVRERNKVDAKYLLIRQSIMHQQIREIHTPSTHPVLDLLNSHVLRCKKLVSSFLMFRVEYE